MAPHALEASQPHGDAFEVSDPQEGCARTDGPDERYPRRDGASVGIVLPKEGRVFADQVLVSFLVNVAEPLAPAGFVQGAKIAFISAGLKDRLCGSTTVLTARGSLADFIEFTITQRNLTEEDGVPVDGHDFFL